MAKGYWVAHVDVKDQIAYRAYWEANSDVLAEFGGKSLVQGGPRQMMEGKMASSIVVVEFPSVQAARACYDSDRYRAARELRENAAASNIAIVEGEL